MKRQNTVIAAAVLGTMLLSACGSSRSPANPSVALPAVADSVLASGGAVSPVRAQALDKAVSADAATGRLAYDAGKLNAAGGPAYDLPDFIAANPLTGVPIPAAVGALGGVKRYDLDGGNVLYLRDPASTHLQYSGLGRLADSGDLNRPDYVSFGTEYRPTANVQAQYVGAVTGTYGSREMFADLRGELDWNSAAPNASTLHIRVENPYAATNDNITDGQVNGWQQAANLAFDTKLQWDNNRFADQNGTAARIYGKNDAAEIGGTFKRDVGGTDFQGAFFGLKQ